MAKVVGPFGLVVRIGLTLERGEFIDAVLEITSIHTGQHLPFLHHIAFIDEEFLHQSSTLRTDIHPSNRFQLTAGCDHAWKGSALSHHGEIVQLT